MNWLKRHIPTRETIQRHRLLRPFARQLSQPALWHMTHRSVPRAVALGLGIGVIIPYFHTDIASLLAIPLPANVEIAAARQHQSTTARSGAANVGRSRQTRFLPSSPLASDP
jgi:uncharacterized protein (DUF2062 family)